MNIVRAFFFQNGVTFLKKIEKGKGRLPPSPSSYASRQEIKE